MDRQEVSTMLEPFLEKISRCILQGCDDTREDQQQFLHKFTKRTISGITRDCIWDNIRREFSEEEKAKIHESENGLCILEISGVPLSLCIRFKKFNKRILSSNISTRQVESFLWQHPPLRQLTTFPSVNLNAGYLTDESGTDVEVYIAKPRGSRSNAWIMRISQDAQHRPIVQLPLPKSEKPRPWRPKTDHGQAKKGTDNEGPNNNQS